MRSAILLLSLLAVGCARVDPGNVGIKFNYYGTQKGVEDFPLLSGRVALNHFTEELFEYPTFMQNVVWTGEEAITFNSSEGAVITADVGLSYTLAAEKVPALFIKFRQPIDVVTATYLRTKTRDAYNRVGGKFQAVQIFGEQKQEFLDGVQAILAEELADDAFQIDTVSIIGAPRADERVMNSIQQVIEATQDALRAENKVRQIEAEAKQKVAEAKGDAESILARATAQAESNRLLTESITPQLIQYELMRKWDGIAPKVMGADAGMLLSVDAK